MKWYLPFVIIMIVSFAMSWAYADEMDAMDAPAGMIVRMDNQTGHSTFFTAKDDITHVDSEKEVAAAIAKTSGKGEAVTMYRNVDEMDIDTSTRAWYWYSYYNQRTYYPWNPWGYSRYNYFGWNNYRYHYGYSWRYPRYTWYFYY